MSDTNDTIEDATKRDNDRRLIVKKRENALRSAKTLGDKRWAKLGIEILHLDGWLGGYEIRNMIYLHSNKLIGVDELEMRLEKHKETMKRKLMYAKKNAPEIYTLYTNSYYNKQLYE